MSSAMRQPSSSSGEPLTDASAVSAALTDLEVDYVRHRENDFLVTLPGERRHRTLVWLILARHELMIESFVCRSPDENAEAVYQFLLKRNAQLRSVAYMLDHDGDIHLVGRISRSRVTAGEIDRLLGAVLAASDADFNPILERAFPSAIRREWAWRAATGQSLRNLAAFRHLIGD